MRSIINASAKRCSLDSKCFSTYRTVFGFWVNLPHHPDQTGIKFKACEYCAQSFRARVGWLVAMTTCCCAPNNVILVSSGLPEPSRGYGAKRWWTDFWYHSSLAASKDSTVSDGPWRRKELGELKPSSPFSYTIYTSINSESEFQKKKKKHNTYLSKNFIFF